MITINCDMGERGADHPVDIELMRYISMANIACGGHAGDVESVKVFLKKAEEMSVKVTAHLSYPDRENFGRTTMHISAQGLLKSLDEQCAMMPHVKTVKLHGALYNNANVDVKLAKLIAKWMKNKLIKEIVTPFDSKLAVEAKKLGLKVIPEAFAERRYTYNPQKKQLTLVSRKKDYASIKDCEEALEHTVKIIKEGRVTAYVEDAEGKLTTFEVPIQAETICIHSDSEISLDLARRLAGLL